jgi:sugar/nucleoside kinase (ribokinase family)
LVKPDRATLAGVCLCLPDAERTRLTCPGANTGMAGHLATARAQIVGRLSAARVIHVTSLLDAASTAALRRVLAAARQANPGALMSIDPGHLGAASSDPNSSALVELADLVIVNDAEFRALGGGGGWPRCSAEGLLRRLHPRTLVVVKHPHGSTVWRRDGDTISQQDWSQRRLRDAQIVAPAGAGDVFAAGMLAGLLRECRPGMRPELDDVGAAVRLGQAMARRSLRGQTTGPDDIPRLTATPTPAAGPA